MANANSYNGRRTKRHLIARIPAPERHACDLSGVKELCGAWSVTVIYKDQILEPIRIRWYHARTTRPGVMYCSVWIHGQGAQNSAPVGASGFGRDNSVGSDRMSGALDAALESAGVELYGSPYARKEDEIIDYRQRASISGVGDAAMREACHALVEALGYRGFTYIATH